MLGGAWECPVKMGKILKLLLWVETFKRQSVQKKPDQETKNEEQSGREQEGR